MRDDNWIDEALIPAYHNRKNYINKARLEAYRLYNRDHFDLPVAVDIYGKYCVIHLFGHLSPAEILQIKKCINALIPVKGFFIKDRTVCAGDVNTEKLQLEQPLEIIVNEYGHNFYVNLSDYRDLGLFLDHRETRKWVGDQAQGKIVLNTFAYTGSFSVYAAAGGAAKTYSVDLSRRYCDWIRRNLELNRLPPEQNWVYKMDTLEFFRYSARKHLSFDIIIIDPPTFSKNKCKNFSVQRDHPELITLALPLLTPGGFIIFSNNYTEFQLSQNLLKICQVEEREDLIPADFIGTCPHRCFIIRK